MAQAIVNVAEAFENYVTLRNGTLRTLAQTAVSFLGQALKGVPGMISNAVDFFISQLDIFYQVIDKTALDQKMKEMYENLRRLVEPYTGYNWTNLASTKAGLVVNIWGSKDQLTKGNILGGYIREIGGYSVNDRNKPLFNIEIEGANHFDYIKNVRSAEDWIKDFPDQVQRIQAQQKNETISQFVAQLILNSNDKDKLRAFLGQQIATHKAHLDSSGTWIVTIL
ncbi:MAG: hypothetical protein EXS63_05475 [Candidatus Omnitrophica bacterium]|nr:hypothetical protein [Candidatus Omnitrophota bacterium]